MNLELTRRQLLNRAGLALGAAAITPSVAPATDRRSDAPAHWFGYSLNTATIRGQKLTLPEQIEVVAKAGYDGIEPWIADVGKFVESGGSLKDLGKRCSDLGLKVVDVMSFAQWVVDDDALRAKGVEQMKREMEQTAQLGGTHIAAPPAGVYKSDIKLDLDRAAERYRVILEMGRQLGVVPQLEFWGGSANLNHLAQAAYVAARAGHPDACVLADVYHLHKGGTDPAALKLLGREAVRVFHMNDYPADPPRETIKDSNRVWPGDGIAPMKQILTHLAANHCRVMLSLELFNADYWKLPALDACRTGLAKMKAVAQGSQGSGA
jgi:sugar phosphate isomerase/epimerase